MIDDKPMSFGTYAPQNFDKLYMGTIRMREAYGALDGPVLVLIAALIVWVGDQIGVGAQLSTAVVVVLGIRIFTNAAAIRRALFHA